MLHLDINLAVGPDNIFWRGENEEECFSNDHGFPFPDEETRDHLS